MNTASFKQTGQAVRAFRRSARWLATGLLAAYASLAGAQPTVTTLAGFDAGYANGNSKTTALFNRPAGIALNTTNTILFVADQNNNVVREMLLDASPPTTLTFATYPTYKFNQPIGVLVDATNNLYVLNHGTGSSYTNGTIVWFNQYGNFLGTLASRLTNATAFTMDGLNNLYVTESNRVVEFAANSSNGVPIVAITSATISTNGTNFVSRNVSLMGIAVFANGLLAVTDAGNNGIWLVNPETRTASQFTGFHGAGSQPGIASDAQFNQPHGIAYAGGGVMVVSDYGNDQVVTVGQDGLVQFFYGIPPSEWFPGEQTPGWFDGPACDNEYDGCAEAREPYGVTVAQDGDVFTTEIYYDIIRQTTPTGFTGPGPTPGVTPLFNNPQGIALDNSGAGLYIADQANNAIELLNLGNNTTTTFLYPSNGISRPSDVAFDNFDDLYVLNRGTNATGGSLLEFNEFGKSLGTIATGLSMPTALTIDTSGNIFVADQGGAVQEFSGGTPNTIATVTSPGVSLQGIALFNNGTIAVSDAGNDVLWQINPVGDAVSLLSGAVGQQGSGLGQFNQPHQLVLASGNQLLVSDSGNNRIVAVQSSGVVTNVLVSTNSEIWFGRPGDPIPASSSQWVAMAAPMGVAVGPNGTVYDSEDVSNLIRGILVTGFTSPPAPSPAPAPVIGEVVFADTNDTLTTFITVSNGVYVLNNTNASIAIEGNGASQIFYNFDPIPADVMTPTPTNAFQATPYINGQAIMPASIIGIQPTETIEAVGVNPGSPESPVVSATVEYVTANPSIQGNNAAQFSVSDNTPGAQMYYTIDGATPVVGAADTTGPITNNATLSLNISTNVTFTLKAFASGFAASGVAQQVFYLANVNANAISFGFASGEASSQFVASPGQFFYAPVTMSVLSGTEMYSLQFNMTVTNVATNSLGAVVVSPPVQLGDLYFQSMLETPDPSNSAIFYIIPPGMAVTNAYLGGFYTNPPPPNLLFTNNGATCVYFTNVVGDEIAVAWLERLGEDYLYPTVSQDLIQYSQAHDDQFLQVQGKVVVGGFAFRVPTNAVPGNLYQIQINRPSATSDGIGAPGSEVYIATPTTGSLTNGAVNSIKNVGIGQNRYIVGDCAPFGWFNAGDFGNGYLEADDVAQVFEAAVYALNAPPIGSDFFDSMDSCCGLAVETTVGTNVYWVPSGNALTADGTNSLYSADDSILLPSSPVQVAFGDGKLDVTDVYVTWERSEFGALTWFQRFWLNGQRVAQMTPNVFPDEGGAPDTLGQFYTISSSNPAVAFYAGDAQGSGGQTVQIPITARTEGSYPLRVLMINLTVNPLDGAPPLTSPVQFSPITALGAPYPSASSGFNNFAGAWLSNSIPGLSSNALIGTLSVTIPAGAGPMAAYAVHFDHASGSPNGLASFPVTAHTGVITLSDRSSSYFNDGIPDLWRLRYFGTAYNMLSMASADADGDGANNWQEYEAGTDPNDAQSVLRANAARGTNIAECVVSWPAAAGTNYVVQRSTALYGTNWTSLSTNTGNGFNLEFHDITPGIGPRFYRVSPLP